MAPPGRSECLGVGGHIGASRFSRKLEDRHGSAGAVRMFGCGGPYRGLKVLAQVRGPPRLRRGGPNVWGVWGAISGPPTSTTRAEAAAAELAGLDQSHEERVERVVLAIARLAQARHGVLAHGADHLEPPAQHGPPLVGQVFDRDSMEAGGAEQPTIAV